MSVKFCYRCRCSVLLYMYSRWEHWRWWQNIRNIKKGLPATTTCVLFCCTYTAEQDTGKTWNERLGHSIYTHHALLRSGFQLKTDLLSHEAETPQSTHSSIDQPPRWRSAATKIPPSVAGRPWIKTLRSLRYRLAETECRYVMDDAQDPTAESQIHGKHKRSPLHCLAA
jgi:hypothetical protein